MTETRIVDQPAFVLHSKKYRETGLLLDCFSRDYGRLPIIANGVRTEKSKTAALLQPFQPLSISCLGRGELKTLVSADWAMSALSLTGKVLYCGFYINELTTVFLHQYDPHPDVFAAYYQCLNLLSQNNSEEILAIEAALRHYEWVLLHNVGFGLTLDYDAATGQPVNDQQYYRFIAGQGVFEDSHGHYPGHTLLQIMACDFAQRDTLLAAKQLFRAAIDEQLQGRRLNSRHVMNQIIKTL